MAQVLENNMVLEQLYLNDKCFPQEKYCNYELVSQFMCPLNTKLSQLTLYGINIRRMVLEGILLLKFLSFRRMLFRGSDHPDSNVVVIIIG